MKCSVLWHGHLEIPRLAFPWLGEESNKKSKDFDSVAHSNRRLDTYLEFGMGGWSGHCDSESMA